eukprot:gene15447-4637_t
MGHAEKLVSRACLRYHEYLELNKDPFTTPIKWNDDLNAHKTKVPKRSRSRERRGSAAGTPLSSPAQTASEMGIGSPYQLPPVFDHGARQ